MARITISFRVNPWHYRAIQEEIRRGTTLTKLFEDMLIERFPVTSRSFLRARPAEQAEG